MSLSDEAKDDLIISVHDAMMKETDPSKKLFFAMMKNSGIPLVDILKEGMGENGHSPEFLADYLNALTNFVAVVALGIANVYLPERAFPEFVEMFARGIRENLTERHAVTQAAKGKSAADPAEGSA